MNQATPTNPEFTCQATAAFLQGGRSLAGASHAAALLSGVACFFPGSTVSRLCAAAALLLWPIGCYLLLRVSIDEPLFRNSTGDFEALDRYLADTRLRRSNMPAHPRSLEHRVHGALRLFRALTAVILLQVIAAIAALLTR